MERKIVITKTETKIKKSEESRTEFSNVGLIRTTKSEIFSESSLTETEVLTSRATTDSENCSAERNNRGSTESKKCLNIPRMRALQKEDSIKPAILDNFNQMPDLSRVHGGNLTDNKPFVATDNTKYVNLHEFNEATNSSGSFKANPSECDDAGENVITEVKRVGCNSSNEINSNTNEVFENSISGSSSIKNQENAECHGMKVSSDGKINVHYTCNSPTQISYEGALNLESAGKLSNINTESNNLPLRSPNGDKKITINLGAESSEDAVHACNSPTQICYKGALNLASADGKVLNINTELNNLPLRSPNGDRKITINLGAESSEDAAHTKNRIKNINIGKELKENKFFKKNDVREQGDNSLISSEDKEKNKVGVLKGKDNFNKSVTYLVNYFEDMKTPSPKKTDVKSSVSSSEKRKLSERTKRQKRKLTDYHSLPNKKTPLRDSLNSCLPTGYFNAENCTKNICIVSQNIELLKKSNEDVQPSHKADPNLNFNDDMAEFCVVKCRHSQSGAKKLTKTPRQPREKSFVQRAMEQSSKILNTPKSHLTRSPDFQRHARENVSQPNILPDKSTKTKGKNDIGDISAADNGNASIGGIELRSFNDIAGYQHQKFNKASIDEQKLQKSHLVLERKICINNPVHLRRHLKAGMRIIKESTNGEEKGKMLEKEESSFVKCFSTLILFMVIFAFGSYYKFFT